ncbi:methionine adenosyltransferase domain-containing protein [Candidatus Woesearchaeota archaeon]|nr:methionine adenosyltransferase domain-containing protein [Candidatus Woesearchaeota archaeon]
MEYKTHAFEAGRRGKPDEIDSSIAHIIGASLIELGNKPRFDIRVSGGYDAKEGKYSIDVKGEVSEHVLNKNTFSRIKSDSATYFNRINRTNFSQEDFIFRFEEINPQSDNLGTNGSSGDSGNPIGVAVSNAPNFMPWERYLAVEIRDVIDNIYRNEGKVPEHFAAISGVEIIPGLKSDGKVNVNARYQEGAIYDVQRITIAAEHEENSSLDEISDGLSKIIVHYLKHLQEEYGNGLVDLGKPEIIVNGRGPWHNGTWKIDAGSREAKPYRDGFASHGCNEDSFSGEDPTKVSATGSFMARHIATQIIAQEFAEYAHVTLDYVIGSDDVGINIFTDGTTRNGTNQEKLNSWAKTNFPLKISEIIETFGLWDAELYRKIADDSDFFHNPELPWNDASDISDLVKTG